MDPPPVVERRSSSSSSCRGGAFFSSSARAEAALLPSIDSQLKHFFLKIGQPSRHHTPWKTLFTLGQTLFFQLFAADMVALDINLLDLYLDI